MDGLLLDTERVGRDVFVDLVAPHGMAQAEAQALYVSLVGTSEAATEDALQSALPGVDSLTLQSDWNRGVDAAMARGVPLRPTVADTILGLARRAVPMAVVTSTRTARARAHLAEAGLVSCFVDVIGGDRVPAAKPDPAPYRLGAAALGLPPEACAAFEDSDTGTQAACAAGCITWQVPDLRPHGRPLPQLGQRQAATLAEAVAAAGI